MAFDFLSFLPLFQETLTSIRARLDADLNAGLEPTDERRTDTREGTFYADLATVTGREMARMWDAISTELPAAASPATAWGEYLDNHAQVFGLVRKAATYAEGEVLFAGAAGTLIPQNTEVSTTQTDPDIEPVQFQTTESGVTSAALVRPTGLGGTDAAGSGTLPAGTYYYAVTALSDFGETEASIEATVINDALGHVVLDWGDVAGATGYRVYRGITSGELFFLTETVASTYTDDNSPLPSTTVVAPSTNTSAGIRLSARAVDEGVVGNVAAGAINQVTSTLPGITLVSNELSFTGGTEVEDDEALRSRLLLEYEGAGAGNVTDYKRWALAEPGVGRVAVVPVWDGPGTVLVVVMTAEGEPVSAGVVDSLQDRLDPAPGEGAGEAPIGAVVTVATPTQVSVPVTASVTFKPGYSLDGTSGTTAQRAIILDALNDYIESLEVGDTVIKNHVEAQFFLARGVLDVTLSAPSGNVTLTTDPPQVATLGTVTLS